MTRDRMSTDKRLGADIVRALVERDRPDDALVAALFASALPASTVDSGGRSLPPATELLKRARSLAPSDPLIAWASLMIDCHPDDQRCDARPNLQRLIALDPNNAYPWTLAIAVSPYHQGEDAASLALSKAATAERYDDYSWSLMRRAIDAATSLPDLPRERDLTFQPPGMPIDRRAVRMEYAFGAIRSIPGYLPLDTVCIPTKDRPLDPARLHDCRALAKRMIASTSLSAGLIGSEIGASCAAEDAERTRISAVRRRLRYLMESQDVVFEQLDREPDGMQRYGERRLKASGEIDFLQSELRRAGIGVEPPPGWEPDERVFDEPEVAPAAAGQPSK